MWQTNESWTNKLFNPLEIKRFSTIKINSPNDMSIAVFRRRNANESNNDYQNLQLVQILSQPGDVLGKLDTLASKFYYVAIENRRLTIPIIVTLFSADGIEGQCNLNIEYQVSDLDALFTTTDPVAGMRARIEQTVQFIASQREHTRLTIGEIMQAVYDLNQNLDIGLYITNAFIEPLVWVNVINVPAEIARQNQQDRVQRNQRLIIIKKMEDLGVNNKLLETALLSRVDKDYNVVMQQIQGFMQANKDNAEARVEILQWLANNNYISRDQLDPLIQSAISVVTNPQPTPGDILLNSGQQRQAALPPASSPTPPTATPTPPPASSLPSRPPNRLAPNQGQQPAKRQPPNPPKPVVERRRPFKSNKKS